MSAPAVATDSVQDSWQRPAVRTLLILIASFAPGILALHGDFFFLDDRAMVANSPFITGERSIWSAFSEPYFSHYAPLHELLIYVQWQLFGNNAFAFRAVSLLLHFAAALGCFQMLRVLTNRPGLALWVTLIWAAHPMHSESVAWISEQKTLWCFACCFWALAIYFDETWPVGKRLAVAALLFIIGSLAKTPGMVVGPLVLLYELTRRSETPLPQRLLRTAPFLLLAAVFSALALWAVKAPQITKWGPADTLLNIPNALLIYLKVAFLPWTASFFHYAPRVTSFGDIQFFGNLAVVVGIFAAGIALVGAELRRQFVFLGLAWALAIGPMLNVSMWTFPAYDRFQYLAAAFLFLGAALLLEQVLNRIGTKAEKADAVRISTIGAALPVIVVLVLGLRHGRLYEREVFVMQDAAVKEPLSVHAQAGLAGCLHEEWQMLPDEPKYAADKQLMARTALLATIQAKKSPQLFEFYTEPVQLHLRTAEMLRFSGMLPDAEALLVAVLDEPRFLHSASVLGRGRKMLADVKLQMAETQLQRAQQTARNAEESVQFAQAALALIAKSAEILPLSNEGHWLAQIAHTGLAKLTLERGDKKKAEEHKLAAAAALRAIKPDSRFYQQAQTLLALQNDAQREREARP